MGYLRKSDPPSEVSYYATEPRVASQRIWLDSEGMKHRENDLPAEIHYYKNKKIQTLSWWRHGNLHRLYGPAWIDYISPLSSIKGIWFVNGKNITSEIFDFIKEYNLPKWQEWNNNHKILFKLKFGG